MNDVNRLGQLYLGRRLDTDEPLLYQARDLTTHAVCLGMTGLDPVRLEEEITDLEAEAIEEEQIRPTKSRIYVERFGVAWVPCWEVAYEDDRTGDLRTTSLAAFEEGS